jgi:serine/threonine protein kinase/Tfp pilus assembly protein PilF
MGKKAKTILCQQCRSPIAEGSRFCSRCGHIVEDKADTLTYTPPLEKILDDHLIFSPGEKFGPRYRIIEEIGQGGMGRIYKAKDQELDITVALKMIRPAYSSNPRFIQRFKEETLLSRSISHENVIRIHDIGEVDGIKFISMDYIKGHDLKELIKTSGTLSIQTAISITRQICEGLRAAHQKHIIHLDLKPRNIMIDGDGKVYVMDFGVARSLEVRGFVQEKMLIGTPAYVSPEQAKGEEVDKRSDIYSLGIILFEMLTGKRPFEADNLDDFVTMHIHKKPPRPSELIPQIPPLLDEIVLRCLKKDKNKRYQDVSEILADLQAHKEESQTYMPQIKTKKRGSRLYIIPLIFILVVAGLFWLLGRKKPTVPSALESGKIPLVVMFFENHTGDEALDEWRMGLCHLIISDLHQSHLIKVLPSDVLFKILENLNLVDRRNYSSEDLNKVTHRGGANHLLYGYYTKADDTYRIDVVLKNMLTGEITTQRFEGQGDTTFFVSADSITQWIKTRLNFGSVAIAADSDKNIQDILTDSPEALKLYIKSKQSYHLGDFQESNRILQKALEMDSEFAMALRQISENYHYMGKIDMAKQYARSALSMKDNVSLRDRYLLEGWALTILEESYENAEKIYLRMLQNFPDDEDANIKLGAIYRNMEEWDLALERFDKIKNVNPIMAIENTVHALKAKGEYEKALRYIRTNEGIYHNAAVYHLDLANIYFYQKKFDLSLQEFEKVIMLEPDHLDAKEMLGHLYFIQDEFDRAEHYFVALVESKSPVHQFYGRLWLLSLCIAQGRYEDCLHILSSEIKKAEEEKLESDKLTYLNLLAYVNLRIGRFEEAVEVSKKAESIATNLKFNYDKIVALRLRGFALLRMNKIEEAKEAAHFLKNYLEGIKIPKYSRYHRHLEGLIALQEKRYAEAVENFKDAISLLSFQHEALDDHALYLFSLAVTYYEMDEWDLSQQQFQKIIELTSGRIQWGDIYAMSYYWSGKIYQKTGQKHKAEKHLEKFLRLWVYADSRMEEKRDAQTVIRLLKENDTPS